MKFRYYIVDIIEIEINGTNDESLASEFAASEDYCVIDSEDGVWITSTLNDVQEAESPMIDDDGEDEE